MNIYLLEPNTTHLPLSTSPWETWYDKCFAMVVVANNEEDARSVASEGQSGEGEVAWLKSEYSECTLLGKAIDGAERGIVIQDISEA